MILLAGRQELSAVAGWLIARAQASQRLFPGLRSEQFPRHHSGVPLFVSQQPDRVCTRDFFTVLFLFINNAPFHAILVNSVSATVRATAVALNIVAIHICGDVISRFGVGVLSDSLLAGRLKTLASLAAFVGIEPMREHLTSSLARCAARPAGVFFVFLVGS